MTEEEIQQLFELQNWQLKRRKESLQDDRYKELLKNITKQEAFRIEEFYAKTPRGYVVDHIIPLSKGGLHHPDNLQYLTNEQNLIKSDQSNHEGSIIINGEMYVKFDKKDSGKGWRYL